jgi:predicted DCC family thiol-disulfide oxidoreductase YuxK
MPFSTLPFRGEQDGIRLPALGFRGSHSSSKDVRKPISPTPDAAKEDAMEKLYVLYDPKCEICCRLKNWILVQRSWIGMAVLEAGSEKAKRLFPELEGIAGKDDLAVISDEGAVYLNDRAWIMVLYAMVEYRDWAARLTHPLLMPLARQAFAVLSKNRHTLSRLLTAEDPEAIAGELRKVTLEPCALPVGDAPVSQVREFLQ